MNSNNTIGKLLLKRSSTTPKQNSLGWIENNQVHFFSFKSYRDAIECIAMGLVQVGFTKSKRLSILASTSKYWHIMDYATLCLQGIVVPIYSTYTPKEISFIFNHSESEFLVVENESLLIKVIDAIDGFKNLKVIIYFNEIKNSIQQKIPSHISVYSYKELTQKGVEKVKELPLFFEESINTQSPEDIATIIYTSGTTGVPKGAVITHEAFVQMLHNISEGTEHAFSEKDRTLIFLPLSHVLGRCDSFLCTLFGWEMVFAESTEKVIGNIKTVKPSVMIAVPRIFEKIYAHVLDEIDKSSFTKKKVFKWALNASIKYYKKIDNDKIPSSTEVIQKDLAYELVFKKIYELFGGRIRFFVTGGAPLSPKIINFLRNSNLSILEGYGLTETMGPCVLNPLFKQVSGTVGKPIGDVEIKLASDGEILVKTKAMLKEYFKNPKATEDSIQDGWLKTGDIGIFIADGSLKITDRKKDIIITSGGKNIAPQKIENLMKSKKYISNIVVIGDQRKYLSALVALEKSSLLDILNKLGLDDSCRPKQLAGNSKLRAIIQSKIDEGNSELPQFETIKRFEILPIELTTENYLTPSLKVRKKEIIKDFQDLIEKMY